MTRVDEMIAHYNSGGYIPRIVHLADVFGEGLVCYDGNHRRHVLDQVQNSEDDITCIVDVIFDVNQNDVYKAFNNINKSVQLPAIYLIDPQSKVKEDILTLVKKYEEKYKIYTSTSARCHPPHFNRDTFTDNLFDIYKYFNGTLSIDRIETLIEKLNVEYSKQNMGRPHASYRPSVIAKCIKQNLFLFIEKAIPCHHLHDLSQR
jgi:hypothetical protein